MAAETLPQLSESSIRGMASEASFERGKSYYHSGAILDPVRQGTELRAECEGSQYEPYQVSSTLEGKGLAAAHAPALIRALASASISSPYCSLMSTSLRRFGSSRRWRHCSHHAVNRNLSPLSGR